jgi:hypothetical protein
MYEPIPVEVLEKYEGKWIVWDQDDARVVGSGDTIDEAEDEAAASAPPDHLLRRVAGVGLRGEDASNKRNLLRSPPPAGSRLGAICRARPSCIRRPGTADRPQPPCRPRWPLRRRHRADATDR